MSKLLRSNHVPIQRLIISLSSSSGSNFAHTLIRNCDVPRKDIQIGNDHTLGFSANIAQASSKLAKNLVKNVPKWERKLNRDLYTVRSLQTTRMLDRPMYEDFGCDLYCDRLMLGEPPIRTALICPYLSTRSTTTATNESSGRESDSQQQGITFDATCKILQQFQSIQPEDILVVVDDFPSQQLLSLSSLENKHSSHYYYLGPIPENQDINKSSSALSQVLEAIQWRFTQNNDNNELDDDEDPIQFVSCLFVDNNETSKVDDSSSTPDDENDNINNTKTLLAAMWCSHPDAAAIATKIVNDEIFNKNKKLTSNEELEAKQAIINQIEKNNNNHLFQFSMIRLRHEKLLEAAHHPHLVRALVPGVAPTAIRKMTDKIGEEVREKMKRDEMTRKIGRTMIEELLMIKNVSEGEQNIE